MSCPFDDFRMPRFAQLPDVGLYLDQVVRYINRSIQPLGLPQVTPSMVSNYVKKHYVTAPVRKQYTPEQLARLMVLSIGKTVLPMDRMALLLQRWDKLDGPFSLRYDAWCADLEQAVQCAYTGDAPAVTAAEPLTRSLNVAVAHVIRLDLDLRVQDSTEM